MDCPTSSLETFPHWCVRFSIFHLPLYDDAKQKATGADSCPWLWLDVDVKSHGQRVRPWLG
jgi:hypothetical protein